jgi:hypothetical protein
MRFIYVLKIKGVSVQTIKVYGGLDVKFHSLLIAALHEGQWPRTRPGCFDIEESSSDLPTELEAGWIPGTVWTL